MMLANRSIKAMFQCRNASMFYRNVALEIPAADATRRAINSSALIKKYLHVRCVGRTMARQLGSFQLWRAIPIWENCTWNRCHRCKIDLRHSLERHFNAMHVNLVLHINQVQTGTQKCPIFSSGAIKNSLNLIDSISCLLRRTCLHSLTLRTCLKLGNNDEILSSKYL